jgi:hypothetical protein
MALRYAERARDRHVGNEAYQKLVNELERELK